MFDDHDFIDNTPITSTPMCSRTRGALLYNLPKETHMSLSLTPPMHLCTLCRVSQNPSILIFPVAFRIDIHALPEHRPICWFGNTHVTWHVGVSSCGQCHRNAFIVFLMPSLTWPTRLPLASPPHASSRAFSFPTHPLLRHHFNMHPNPTW